MNKEISINPMTFIGFVKIPLPCRLTVAQLDESYCLLSNRSQVRILSVRPFSWSTYESFQQRRYQNLL